MCVWCRERLNVACVCSKSEKKYFLVVGQFLYAQMHVDLTSEERTSLFFSNHTKVTCALSAFACVKVISVRLCTILRGALHASLPLAYRLHMC